MALRLPPLGDSEFEESIRFALKKFFDIRIELIKTFGLCRDLPNKALFIQSRLPAIIVSLHSL